MDVPVGVLVYVGSKAYISTDIDVKGAVDYYKEGWKDAIEFINKTR